NERTGGQLSRADVLAECEEVQTGEDDAAQTAIRAEDGIGDIDGLLAGRHVGGEATHGKVTAADCVLEELLVGNASIRGCAGCVAAEHGAIGQGEAEREDPRVAADELLEG